MASLDCVFCKIVNGQAPAHIIDDWPLVMAFRPLNPVTPGHTLVVPKIHVRDFSEDDDVSAATMRRAAQLARYIRGDVNLITSRGPNATQTVFHLHIHLVPRAPYDGLMLPWSSPPIEIKKEHHGS